MRSSVDVHNYLVERDVPHELFTVRGRLRGPERLAAVLDLPVEQVGRVLVYEAARASELSDYIPEAIPPVALPDGFRVVIDAALASQEIVYFAAGDPAVVLKLRGEDLGRATDAVVAELA